MSTSANRITIPNVSLKLEHIRHYLVLTNEQSNNLSVLIEDDDAKDISNRIGWLLDDLLNMLAKVQDTLYPNDKTVTTARQGA